MWVWHGREPLFSVDADKKRNAKTPKGVARFGHAAEIDRPHAVSSRPSSAPPRASPCGCRRRPARIRFQRGDARVCLFTVEEGISLHHGEHDDVPRSEVIHDLRWSAIQMAQMEGRCHRDGRFAQVYWAYAADTLEEQSPTSYAAASRR